MRTRPICAGLDRLEMPFDERNDKAFTFLMPITVAQQEAVVESSWVPGSKRCAGQPQLQGQFFGVSAIPLFLLSSRCRFKTC